MGVDDTFYPQVECIARLCGPMPVGQSMNNSIIHGEEKDFSIFMEKSAETGFDEEAWEPVYTEYEVKLDLVPVFSYGRGWRWNRQHILKFLAISEEDALRFMSYHEPQLKEILGAKHLKSLLIELGIYAQFKEGRRAQAMSPSPTNNAPVKKREFKPRKPRYLRKEGAEAEAC